MKYKKAGVKIKNMTSDIISTGGIADIQTFTRLKKQTPS